MSSGPSRRVTRSTKDNKTQRARGAAPNASARGEPKEREPKTPSTKQFRIMKQYGHAQWLMIQHCGWNGGTLPDGSARDRYCELLHEGGYHFVKENFIVFVKVPEDTGLEQLRLALRIT